jgi:hypothetical protein
MKTEHDEDRAVTESSLSPVSDDIGEMFLTELQARGERLKHWIRLVSEEARRNGGCAPGVRGSRYKCRGPRIPPRAERRLDAPRHTAAA